MFEIILELILENNILEWDYQIIISNNIII